MSKVTLSADILQANLKDQLAASEELIKVVKEMAAIANDKKNNSASPAIAEYLERIARISKELSASASRTARMAADGVE